MEETKIVIKTRECLLSFELLTKHMCFMLKCFDMNLEEMKGGKYANMVSQKSL